MNLKRDAAASTAGNGVGSLGQRAPAAAPTAPVPRLVTRFGDRVDVRNRGAVRIGRFAGSETAPRGAPAVVRVWDAEHCRELTAHEARAFAAQLLAAAALAENQNEH